ncbi:MAG TPA: methylmalonyl-CoA mutase family protein [Solirubrobacterales bacterium]|nr:methylmalonyl-CoA mutase family protein [Solirubrobacterales bacterium]
MSQVSGDKRLERDAEFSTISGQEIKPLYTEADADGDVEEKIGDPGAYPFTRGPYPSMYRGRLWTMRQFAGFGTVEETNERFHYLLDQGRPASRPPSICRP